MHGMECHVPPAQRRHGDSQFAGCAPWCRPSMCRLTPPWCKCSSCSDCLGLAQKTAGGVSSSTQPPEGTNLIANFSLGLSGCSVEGRIDAHRLSPPRFCNAFNESSACSHHFTPRGLCEWSGSRCITSTACTRRASAASGTSYVFFKFHKVGSSTVGGTLRLALIAATSNPFASCLRHSTLREKTDVERARYTYCSLCAKHDNSLPLLPLFRQPSVLDAPPEKRLRALFAGVHAAKVLDEHCPMRESIGNVLRTGTVIRRPVDRVISK